MPDEFVLIRHIQELLGPGARPVFWFCNFLWGLGLGTLLPAMIFWLGGRKTGFRAGLFTDIGGVTNTYAKWIIAEPRPFYVSDAFTPLKVSTGFGMPSGNAQGIATLMVTICLYAKRKWLWILAAILIFLVGMARVYFGVHSPSQVLLGWIAGIAIALVLAKIAEPFACWFKGRSIVFQIACVLIMAVVLTLIGFAINHLVLQDFVVPDDWVDRYNEIAVATDEEDTFYLFNPNESYAVGAWMFGLGLAGIFLIRDLVPEVETWLGKSLNVILGLGLYYGLQAGSSVIASALRGTAFFWPILMLVWAAFPLLIYTITPLTTHQILALQKSIFRSRR